MNDFIKSENHHDVNSVSSATSINLHDAQKAVWAVWEKMHKIGRTPNGGHLGICFDIKEEAIKQVDILKEKAS